MKKSIILVGLAFFMFISTTLLCYLFVALSLPTRNNIIALLAIIFAGYMGAACYLDLYIKEIKK